MKSPGKTTLSRMQLAAQREAERIEISQDSRVSCAMQEAPMPEQVRLRDDFAGIVRLIDMIQSDAVILERLAKISQPQAPQAVPHDDEAPDEE